MSEYQNSYAGSHALIIGINAYADPQWPPLGNAERDAQEISDLLSASPYNFQARLLLGDQATKQAIQRALFALRKTALDDRLLVYFSGHGYTLTDNFGRETGYLACHDTVPQEDFTALELDEVTGLRSHAQAKHITFIFDSCFSGQALGLTKAATVTAEQFRLRRAYQVLSAGAGDQTVSDWRSMTRYLLPVLRDPTGLATPSGLLTLETLGVYLKQIVAAESGGMQIPQHGQITGSQGGDFVFYEPPPRRPIDLLPERLAHALHSEDADTRYIAIDGVEKLLADPRYAEAAHEVLEDMVIRDPHPEVRQHAYDALQHTPAAPPPASEPARQAPPARATAPKPAAAKPTKTKEVSPTPKTKAAPRPASVVKTPKESPARPAPSATLPAPVLLLRDRATLYPPHSVSGLAWSPDGRWLASISPQAVDLWEIATSRVVLKLPHPSHVWSVAWSPDGRWIASTESRETIRVWEVASGHEVWSTKGLYQTVAWSPDGARLAVGVEGGNQPKAYSLQIREPATGDVKQTLDGVKAHLSRIAWSPDGRWLAAGAGRDTTDWDKNTPSSSTVQVWEASTGKPVRLLKDARRAGADVAWSPDGRYVASAGREGTVSVWESGTWNHAASLVYGRRDVQSLDWSPDGRWIVSGFMDKTLLVWDTASWTVKLKLESPYKETTCLRWSPAGRYLASVTGTGVLWLWDMSKLAG